MSISYLGSASLTVCHFQYQTLPTSSLVSFAFKFSRVIKGSKIENKSSLKPCVTRIRNYMYHQNFTPVN